MLVRRVSTVCMAVWAVLVVGGASCARVLPEPARSQKGMVATVHPLATRAGVDAMKHGGNAVDAAVAAALTLGVVDGCNSGIGGGCLIVIRTPSGQFAAIDGRETAPAKSSRDMYVRAGKADTEASQTGPLASGTPGALAAYDDAIRSFGRLSLRELLLPAAKIAEEGFVVTRDYSTSLEDSAKELAKFPGSGNVLLKDGKPLQQGDVLRQIDLAGTYRSIAEHGTDWFYRGPFAHSVAEWMRANGGILDEADFAQYRSVRREPIVSRYRDLTLVGFPPPSAGGTHVAEILNILEHFDLKKLHEEDPANCAHVIAESMKLAFADRAYWLGDADFADVPRGLVDPAYAASLAKRIDRRHATQVQGHGTPPDALENLFRKHTTHIAAVDADGFWVGITATVNTTFGSKVIVPGTGVILNSEMDDFASQPGVANVFGLVGADANCIQPGKRPLSSMSPTIVLRDGKPVLTVGAAGGPTIISQIVLAIVNHFDLGMPLAEAVASPRFHHQWSPDQIAIEKSTDAELSRRLQALGHTLQGKKRIGVTQAIGLAEDGRHLLGVFDPRVQGAAEGW